MRDPARIDLILEKMNDKKVFRGFLYDHLVGKYGGDQLTINDQVITQHIDEAIVPAGIPKGFEKYWRENPDLRFGQALINAGIAPDLKTLFFIEDDTI